MSLLLWDENIAIVDSGLDLDVDRVQWCMNEILIGAADNSTIKRFLVALKNKGELPRIAGT